MVPKTEEVTQVEGPGLKTQSRWPLAKLCVCARARGKACVCVCLSVSLSHLCFSLSIHLIVTYFFFSETGSGQIAKLPRQGSDLQYSWLSLTECWGYKCAPQTQLLPTLDRTFCKAGSKVTGRPSLVIPVKTLFLP